MANSPSSPAGEFIWSDRGPACPEASRGTAPFWRSAAQHRERAVHLSCGRPSMAARCTSSPIRGEADPVRLPEEFRRLFSCCIPCNADRVQAAIDQPASIDGRYRGCNRRLAPGHGARGNVGRAPPRAARDQSGDVVGTVQASSRIVRIGAHADAAPTYIGIEGLLPHSQHRQCCCSIDPLAHILII